MKESSEIYKLNPEITPMIINGIQAWQSGQRQISRRLFAQAVRDNPHSATAWYWLSRAVDDERQRQECLARVQKLDKEKEPSFRVQHSDAARRGARRASRVSRSISHHSHRRAWAILVILIAALACAATPLIRWQSARAAAPAAAHRDRNTTKLSGDRIQASGIIHAEEVQVASEYGGRVSAILIHEGETIQAGQILVQLDTTLLDAQIQVAQAAVALAEAGLASARAGARPGQIAVAEARLAQAETARLVALQAVTDTKMLVKNPQDIQLQIAVLQAQLESAGHKLAQNLATKDATQIGKDKFAEAQQKIQDMGGPGPTRIRARIAQGPRDQVINLLPSDLRDRLPQAPADGLYAFGDIEIEIHSGVYTLYRWVTVNLNLPFEAHLAPNYWWQAWIGVNAAAAQKEGLEASLKQLYAQLAAPQTFQAQADQAAATLIQTEAQIAAARAQVAGAKAGATAEQIAALEAKVNQARTALQSLQIQRARMTLTAPIGGIVVSTSVHEGEIAAQGVTLLTIADLQQVKLTLYLPENQVGQVSLEQPVQVSVDSFPGRTFEGTVIHIADTAEFTPRNVATQEERVNLVYAVEVSMPNQKGELKPGMPADAAFGD